MVLENNVQKILFRQLDNFWDGWNKEVISIKISQALGEMQENYLLEFPYFYPHFSAFTGSAINNFQKITKI